MDWLALILSTIGIYYNANKKISCWYYWIISNIFWAIYAFTAKSYPLFILQFIFGGMNIYGLIKWKNGK